MGYIGIKNLTFSKGLPYFKIFLIFLLILSNLKSLVQQLPEDVPLSETNTILLSKWEQRFEPIKEKLPSENGIIGYVADWDTVGGSYSKANSSMEYTLAQYTMAPIIVSRKPNLEWFLVNMDVDDFNLWLTNKSGEYEVTKYGFNLYLVHEIR